MYSTRHFLFPLFVVVTSLAQAPRLQLDSIERLAGRASEKVNVSLEGASLQQAGRLLEKDPALLDVIQKLRGVYVRSYRFDRPGVHSPSDLGALQAQLQGPGWKRIVSSDRKARGLSEVHSLQGADGKSLALAVLTVEPKEVTVVNLVGDIDIGALGALEGHFGIPRADDNPPLLKVEVLPQVQPPRGLSCPTVALPGPCRVSDKLPLSHGARGYRVEVPVGAAITLELQGKTKSRFHVRLVDAWGQASMGLQRENLHKLDPVSRFTNPMKTPVTLYFLVSGPYNDPYTVTYSRQER